MDKYQSAMLKQPFPNRLQTEVDITDDQLGHLDTIYHFHKGTGRVQYRRAYFSNNAERKKIR
jgi:hypothetical protein